MCPQKEEKKKNSDPDWCSFCVSRLKSTRKLVSKCQGPNTNTWRDHATREWTRSWRRLESTWTFRLATTKTRASSCAARRKSCPKVRTLRASGAREWTRTCDRLLLVAALDMVYRKAKSATMWTIEAPSWKHRHVKGPKGATIQRITQDYPKVILKDRLEPWEVERRK